MKLTTALILIGILTACCLAAPADDVKPVAMSQKTILCANVPGTPTKGFENGTGIYTIGLLIKTWGKVTYRDPNGKFFYIDDGSKLWDGTKDSSNHNVLGVRVSIDNLASGNSIDLPPATWLLYPSWASSARSRIPTVRSGPIFARATSRMWLR